MQSIRQFVDAFESQLGGAPLHTLVNNAGANFMGRDPWHTAAGVAGIPAVGCCVCSRMQFPTSLLFGEQSVFTTSLNGSAREHQEHGCSVA